MQIYAEGLNRKQGHFLLDSIVCPRPIFLISTKSKNGVSNLAPYSMSGIACTKPPMVCYSSVIRPDGSEKDTLTNIKETGEFIVNMVTENVINNVLIAARNYPPGESELDHTNLTTSPGLLVAPYRVLESPVNMECTLCQIIELGEHHSLVIGEVKVFHVEDSVYTGKDIDLTKLTVIGRMGGSAFIKATDIFSNTDEWDLNADLALEKD